MNDNFSKKLLGIFSIALLSSCTMAKYGLVQNNVSNLKQNGDVSINPSLTVGSGGNVTSFDANVNGGYAIGDKYGIYVSSYIGIHDNEVKSLKFKRMGGELGFGMHKLINKELNMELFGGGGYSNSLRKVDYLLNNNYYRFGYNISHYNMFIQNNYIFEKNNFYFSFSGKLNFLHFTKVEMEGDVWAIDLRQLEDISQNKNKLLFEPAIEVGTYFDKFTIYVSYKYNADILNQNYYTGNSFKIGHVSYNCGLGVKFNFNTKQFKK